MSIEDLLTENNRLMQRLLDIEEENRRLADEAKSEFDAKVSDMKVNRDGDMKSEMMKLGLSEEAASGSEEDWEKRFQETQKKSNENIEIIRAKDQAYKEALLKEMNEQTALLREISEKLG